MAARKKKYQLTPADRELLATWGDRWIGIVRSTDPMTDAERDDARDAMRASYRHRGVEAPPPEREVFAPSPLTAEIASRAAAAVWWLRENTKSQESACGRVLTDAEMTTAACDAVAATASRAGIEPQATVVATRAAIGAADTSETRNPAVAATTRIIIDVAARARMLSHHMPWRTVYLSFFRRIGLPIDWSAWEPYERLAHYGPHVIHPQFWIVSDRPTTLSMDEQRRIHRADGPYVAWRDGWALYAWHGTTVPKEWIENRESVDPREALTHANIEQRRALAEILGWDRILQALDARVIDAHSDPTIGTLLEVTLPDSDGASRFLRVNCPTGRTFALAVPRDCATALAANAWTYGLDAAAFGGLEGRT